MTPPRLGETVTTGQPCGDIESTKSVNDLVAPVTGTVRARHDELADAPDLVNGDPYGEGWIFEVETDQETLDKQLAALMDAGAYSAMVGARRTTRSGSAPCRSPTAAARRQVKGHGERR